MTLCVDRDRLARLLERRRSREIKQPLATRSSTPGAMYEFIAAGRFAPYVQCAGIKPKWQRIRRP